MIATTHARLKQLNAAMNAGYDLKMAALAQRPEAQFAQESAASRGNPFAISVKCATNDRSGATGKERSNHDRLLQINSDMNKGYMEQLTKLSPTGMQAATRGNPFALFGTKSWKMSSEQEQSLDSDMDGDGGAGRMTTLIEQTSLQAIAAAKGNPFAQFGPLYWHDQSFTNTTKNRRNDAFESEMAAGKQHLEAAVVHEKSRSRAAAVSASKTPKPQQHKSLISERSSASAGAKAPVVSAATPGSSHAVQPSAQAPLPAAGKGPGPLPVKRQPNDSPLRPSLPATPSGRRQSPLPPAADQPLKTSPRGPLDEQQPSTAEASAATVASDSAVHASSASDGCGAITASSTCNEPNYQPGTPPSQSQDGSALPVDDALASDLNFGELSSTIEDLELEIRSLRQQMFGGDAELSDNNTVEVKAMQEDDCASASQIAGSPLRRPCEVHSAGDHASSNLDSISPRALFAETSNDAKAPVRLLPDEQPLTDMLLHSLKLPREVATLVARSMRDTVDEIQADRANFRARFSAQRDPAATPGRLSSVSQMLETAEQAVRLRAAKEAEQEEETFHRKVVAGLVNKNKFFW